MLQSAGVLVKTPDITVWQGNTTQWPYGLNLGFLWASYGTIYRTHTWVATVVDKIAYATARLPLKVYRRIDKGREEARDTPYGQLIRRPNGKDDPFLFWLWVATTMEVYGEAFLGKVRDRGGRPVELVRLHPTSVRDELVDGKIRWGFDNGRLQLDDIPRRDLVHFRNVNPDSDTRGLSRLEALRSTLENEEGAKKANSALWKNGGRPSVVLKHPGTLSSEAGKRLSAQWAAVHGGADNWAKAAVLEEGMEAQFLSFPSEELQYIETRKLNREEVVARYDVPPPVVHILDRATFSNITEQMRSMYRDTMAPRLGLLESTMDFECRDGRMGENREPDFSEDLYAEFLLDEVMRGDFEVRVAAYATAIQTGQLTPSEVRELENRPFIEGSDKLLVNAALVDVNPDLGRVEREQVDMVGALIRAGFQAEAAAAAVGLPAIPHTGHPPITIQPEPLTQEDLRAVMGRLSRPVTLEGIDPDALVAGLNGGSRLVLAELERAKTEGLSVADLRTRVKQLADTVARDDEARRHEQQLALATRRMTVVRGNDGLVDHVDLG